MDAAIEAAMLRLATFTDRRVVFIAGMRAAAAIAVSVDDADPRGVSAAILGIADELEKAL
jgi:hypothetical protein